MQTQIRTHGIIAAEVRAELARQGISGREFARQLNLPQSYMARRLKGDVEITAAELRMFADILGRPVSQFYGETAA